MSPWSVILGIFAVGLGLCSCQSVAPGDEVSVEDFKPIRISDEYQNKKVRSYEVYEWPIPQHCMAMVTLKSGARMPMLCRWESNRINAIPQSVFTTSEPGKFQIMCEPLIKRGKTTSYAMKQITVRSDTHGLVNGRHRVAKVLPKPVQLSINLRTFEDSENSDWEGEDTIEAWVEGSTDGVRFSKLKTGNLIPAIKGDNAKKTNTPSDPGSDDLEKFQLPDGGYSTFQSKESELSIPKDVEFIRVRFSCKNNSASERFFVDDLAVSSRSDE